MNYLADFSCNYPYIRFGPESDRCQSSGKWVNQDETRTCRQGNKINSTQNGDEPLNLINLRVKDSVCCDLVVWVGKMLAYVISWLSPEVCSFQLSLCQFMCNTQ